MSIELPIESRGQKWYTCPLCGQLVPEGQMCDCISEREKREAEDVGMSVLQYRRFQQLKKENDAIRAQKQAEAEAARAAELKEYESAKRKADNLSALYLSEVRSRKRWEAVATIFIFLSVILMVFLLCGVGGESGDKTDTKPSAAETPKPSVSTVAPPTYEPYEPPVFPVLIQNGEIVRESYGEPLAPLTIDTRGDVSFYVYLTGDDEMSFFVRGGSSAEVLVPLGEYEIFYATGEVWQGDEKLFGTDTRYYKCEGIFDFYEDGQYYQGWTLELYAQYDGNMETDPIDATDFPG